jgi:hypothetical protein
MRRIPLLALALSLLAAPALAGDPGDDGKLHFKVEIGTDPVRTVHGYLEPPAPGSNMCAAFLDFDGDWHYEATQVITLGENRNTGEPLPNPKVRFETEGMDWELELFGLFLRADTAGGTITTSVRWKVTMGDAYAWFINGHGLVYRTAEAARKGKAIRLGPPFRFDVKASTRGPDALVTVGLKDANGCTLRMLRAGKATRSPAFVLANDGGQVFEEDLSFG